MGSEQDKGEKPVETFVTYEQYKSATKFARWKYKYGIFVLIACWIALILLIIYIVIYAKELSTHPTIYMMDEMELDYCHCYDGDFQYYINSTSISYYSLGTTH